jgi:hypothetical protein
MGSGRGFCCFTKSKMSVKRKPLSRDRFLVGSDLAFDCMYPSSSQKRTLEVKPLDASQHEHFSIRFVPGLSKQEAMQTMVAVTHLPSRGCHCRLVVIPHTQYAHRQSIGERLKFLVFETHAIQLDAADPTLIALLWLTIENVPKVSFFVIF